jgi:hypothetical protein
MRIAASLGWWSGARSDAKIYPEHRPLYLLDIHWTRYDWPTYLAVVRAERPALAAVPDILTRDGLARALSHAAELAPYCGALLLIPKAHVIDRIPSTIAGKSVVIGYSVPTRYGASPLPLWEYAGRPVHLLGGTPLRQLGVARYLQVISADGNVAQRIAHLGGVVTERGGRAMLRSFHPAIEGAAIPPAALAQSLVNIAAMWRRAGYVLEQRPTVATTDVSAPADRGAP